MKSMIGGPVFADKFIRLGQNKLNCLFSQKQLLLQFS